MNRNLCFQKFDGVRTILSGSQKYAWWCFGVNFGFIPFVPYKICTAEDYGLFQFRLSFGYFLIRQHIQDWMWQSVFDIIDTI